MWRTQEGDRVLQGAEAALFREAMGNLWDAIEFHESINEQYYVDVGPFDHLSVGQKLAMLLQVGEALLDEAVPMPQLTAVNEATVAAVFAQIKINLEVELDAMEGGWRQMIVDALRELPMDEQPESDDEDLDEWDKWELRILSLSDRILWDTDYEHDRMLDGPPEQRAAMDLLMGIDDQYHVELAPEPDPRQIKELTSRLRAIVHC